MSGRGSRSPYVPTESDLEHVKRVKLESKAASFLNLMDLRYPHTWTVTIKAKTHKPITEEKYFQMVTCDFIDVGFDELGQREYVDRNDFAAAIEAKKPLPIYPEEMVKQVRREKPNTVVWFSTYHYGAGVQDYNIVEELSCGSNKLIISNESVLTAPLSGKPSVLDNIALIVNCNMPNPPPYTVKAKKVICHPVHAMCRQRGASDEILEKINQQIWAGLQQGNVVVHCLAGVHRASCIVVSHALYRHFKLKHTHIPGDTYELYARLASIRRGVQPLGYLALVTSFREYLEDLAAEEAELVAERIAKEEEEAKKKPHAEEPPQQGSQ